jgi:hypothetical protein
MLREIPIVLLKAENGKIRRCDPDRAYDSFVKYGTILLHTVLTLSWVEGESGPTACPSAVPLREPL